VLSQLLQKVALRLHQHLGELVERDSLASLSFGDCDQRRGDGLDAS
jgi:hypothetical protein